MKTTFLDRGDAEEIEKALEQLAIEGFGTVGIFAGAQNGLTPQKIDPVLTAARVALFGGVFPEIIYENQRYTQGAVLLALRGRYESCVLKNISDPDLNFDQAIEGALPGPPPETMFVLVDGYARRITALIDGLFNNFGLDANYLGGGAGDLSFQSHPCIISSDGLLADAAQFVFTPLRSGVGVRHGWVAHRGPYRVTAARANIVESIDWRPAAEAYREIVQSAGGEIGDDADFLRKASAFPLGIRKIGAEYLVRDPVNVTPEGGMVFVGEVPEESLVDVLCARVEQLTAAAGEALRAAEESLPEYDQMFLIDCISRALFLGPEFERELAASQPRAGGRFGILSIGEIANNGSSYLDFYNKTAVAGLLKEV